MKTIAVVDAGNRSRAFYDTYFAEVLRASGAEKILVITEGDVTSEGRLAARDKFGRAAMFRAAGASAVVEVPLCGLLLAENVFAFAITCMIQKLGCAQQIAIPVDGDPALFEKITTFLFDQPAPYQKQMRALRGEGRELREVLPGVMEQFVPGAEEFLRRRSNHRSVEMYNSLRLAYYPAKPVIVPVSLPEEAQGTPVQDACLLERLKETFAARTDAAKWAQQMYCVRERTAQRMADMLGGAAGSADLSYRAQLPGEHAVSLRWNMMACLAGYRKVDSFVSIIYNYIPYIRLLDAPDADFRRHLEASVGTTLLVDIPGEEDHSRMNDSAKELLSAIDARARQLFLDAK